MSGTRCFPVASPVTSRACRDGTVVVRLKTGSLLAILITSIIGIYLPTVLTQVFRGGPNYT
jgi:hypothetical protein